jgi:hypothetical protein
MATQVGVVRRRDLEETSADRARAALDIGDIERARAEIDGILAEEKPIHDLYGDMCASFLTFIGHRLGEDAFQDAWRHVAEAVWRPVLWMRLLPAEWGWDVMDIDYDTKSHGEVAITRYVIYKRPSLVRKSVIQGSVCAASRTGHPGGEEHE